MNTLKNLILMMCLLSSTLVFAQAKPINMDALWESLTSNRPFRNQTGWLSDAEVARIKALSPNSEEYKAAKKAALDRYMRAYQSDVKALEANPSRALPHVEAMKTFEASGTNVQTGNQVAAGMRQKMMSRAMKGGGGLLSVADIALVGAMAWKDSTHQALREQIRKDAQVGKCPHDPSDDYAKALIFEELSVQKAILDGCHPADRGMPKQLTAKVQVLRDQYTAKFSGGRARCEYKDGKPMITAVSEAGTQQQILFDERGQFDRLRVLPQPASNGPSKYEGSYLEYSHSPTPQSVTYYAVAKKSSSATGPDLSNSHMKGEPLNSFSARVFCAANGCQETTPEYTAIIQEENLETTPAQPFGNITMNKEFLIDSAKALAQFRLGLEERWGLKKDFRNMCLALGSIPPKQELTPTLKVLPGDAPDQGSPGVTR